MEIKLFIFANKWGLKYLFKKSNKFSFFICTSMVTMANEIAKPMRIWHYLLGNIMSAKTSFLSYTNVNSCFVNYYSHSIKEVDLLYQHLHSGHFYKWAKTWIFKFTAFWIIWNRNYVLVILSINYTKSSKFMVLSIYNYCLKKVMRVASYVTCYPCSQKIPQSCTKVIKLFKTQNVVTFKRVLRFPKIKWYRIFVDVSFWHCVWIRPLFQKNKQCNIHVPT